MPISGLVITLQPDPTHADAVVRAIRKHPHFTCQTMPAPCRLPAVLDTPDRRTDRAQWDWLHALPGVKHVDVVFIHFEEQNPDSAAPLATPSNTPVHVGD